MTEARGWQVGAAEVEGGIWMRRGASPARHGARLARLEGAVLNNKENVPPWRSGWRRKSPLPVWYPRTPLRDITSIVNALERRRMRMQVAAALQRNADAESSPQISVLQSPLPQSARGNAQTPLSEGHRSDAADTIPNPSVVGTTTPSLPEDPRLNPSTPFSSAEQQLQISSTQLISYQAEQTCLVTPSQPTNSLQPAIDEKKLCNSIDEIERVVMKNLKRTKKEPLKKAAQRKTLMSMR